MDVAQLCPTDGRQCGIALFASRLALELGVTGVRVRTARTPEQVASGPAPDVVLLQHHGELITPDDIARLRTLWRGPLVAFAHSDDERDYRQLVDGVVAMFPPSDDVDPLYRLTISHPAWTPDALTTRRRARELAGLPDRPTVGTCGFLKFDRQLDDVLAGLLPVAVRHGWQVQILTSPWRLDSPGVLERLRVTSESAPGAIVLKHGFLPDPELNMRLQACDLLWCWTREPSSSYASGVASTLYASGSRLVVAEKRQHEHVLPLSNVVRAPDRLDGFVEAVASQLTEIAAAGGSGPRHDPDPVSWSHQVTRIEAFLRTLLDRRRADEEGGLTAWLP